METNVEILITSSEDDNEESNEENKKMKTDMNGYEHIKALIEAQACMRRKKRRKKKKNNNSNSQIVEVQAQDQVRVDVAIGEQQVGEPKAIETVDVIERELVAVTGNTVYQKVSEPIVHEMATISTIEVPLSPTKSKETRPPNGVVRSATESFPLSGKVTSMQALTTPSALPSGTIESSMSTQISPIVKIASKNLLAELSSRSKTLKSPLNNETCSSSVDFGSDLLQQQRKAMASFLDMSLENIYHTNSFDNVERTAVTLIQQTSNLVEKSTLENLISHLAQFKENVPNAITLSEAASVQRASLLDKTKTLDAILDQNQDQLSSLEVEFSKLEAAAIEVEDQIQRLITKKEELLLQRNSVALKLEKTSQEASIALGEWRSLEKKNEEINDAWLRGNKMLVQFNNTWKVFRKELDL